MFLADVFGMINKSFFIKSNVQQLLNFKRKT